MVGSKLPLLFQPQNMRMDTHSVLPCLNVSCWAPKGSSIDSSQSSVSINALGKAVKAYLLNSEEVWIKEHN